MAILPISLTVTGTWLDITASVNILELIEEDTVEIYHDGQGLIEVIIDTLGTTTIDSTYDKKGRLINGGQFLAFPYTETTKFWVRRVKSSLKEVSQIQLRKPVENVNIDGVEVFHNALAVYDADVHGVAFNEFFHEHTGVETTLAVAATSGDTSITVVDATGFIIGKNIQIKNSSIEATFPTITAVVGNLLTLDRPLDNIFPIGSSVEAINFEMAVIGTLGAPRAFRLIPDGSQQWHVISLTISMIHGSAGDDSLFGDIAALINGIVFRGFNGTANQHRTNSNWKRNGDFALDFGNLEYTDKAGGGKHSTKAQVSLKIRAGAVPNLFGANGDYLEFLVQDDISAIESVRVKAQGHVII